MMKTCYPCICFYLTKGIVEGKLKRYVRESILPGTGDIEIIHMSLKAVDLHEKEMSIKIYGLT